MLSLRVLNSVQQTVQKGFRGVFEFPLTALNFLIRNRIISGLQDITVVIEARYARLHMLLGSGQRSELYFPAE